MNLYIDIETIPAQREDIKAHIAETITPPGTIKKPESIQKWMEENKASAVESEWRKTGLDGTFGEVLCIGWAINEQEPKGVIRTLDQPESDVLREFMEQVSSDLVDSHGNIRKPVWIGHFLTGFDLRFLWQRYVINGVRPTVRLPYDAKPWGADVFDTKIEWTGATKYSSSGSLDAICRAMGYAGKGDIDGSKVFDYVLEGRYPEILSYCLDDVEKARLLHRRMTFVA